MRIEFIHGMIYNMTKTRAVLSAVLLFLVFIMFFLIGRYMVKKEKRDVLIRRPIAAGTFYPEDKDVLSRMIDSLLELAGEKEINGDLKMLILPHAGYDYSGQTAAYGFKKLIGGDVKRVILIGPSHQDWFSGAALSGHDYWQTPLGRIEIDGELRRKLIDENGNIFVREQAHENEHCLEVMLPFLQKSLKNFTFLPIVISQTNNDFLSVLARTLGKHLMDNDLVIISSDLSHYPSYEDARKADENTIRGILTGSVSGFEKAIQENMAQELPDLDTCACGEEPIKVGLYLAEKMGWDNIELLKYANSGDVGGDKSRVVGYVSFAFSHSRVIKKETLTQAEKQTLLKIARQSIENEFTKKQKSINEGEISEQLKQYHGAFVTLNKDGQLRGCMGRIIEEKEPLYQVVAEMAKVAAFEDPRFYPVGKEEIEEIEIEISILSPMKKIIDPFKEIQVGEHGVMVSALGGQKGGIFLPQVATENNWDLETFMNELCEHKAGLSRDAWKTGDIDIYVFSAEVFGE